MLQSAPGCYYNTLFNTAITTIQTNSAIDQNIRAKTAQAPLNFLEYCSQSVKLHSCAYSCPTYQLCAHKNASFQIPEYSSTPFCAVKQRVQPCHTNMGIQRRYHSKTLCKGWSYLKAAFLHLALTDQPNCSTCVVPGNKANKPFILTLQFLFQIIYLNIAGYFAYIKSCSKGVPKISSKPSNPGCKRTFCIPTTIALSFDIFKICQLPF